MFDTAWHAAAANWSKWRIDYNWSLDWVSRPLFRCDGRFDAFCTEYSLSRNIPGDPLSKEKGSELTKIKRIAAEQRRNVVRSFFQQHGSPNAFTTVDHVAHRVACFANRKHGELKALPKGHGVSISPSLVSKVWCFAAPDKYPRSDRLNKAALKHGHRYAGFFEKFETAQQALRASIESENTVLTVPEFVAPDKREAFRWRVTDNYLMIVGARNLVFAPETPLRPAPRPL